MSLINATRSPLLSLTDSPPSLSLHFDVLLALLFFFDGVLSPTFDEPLRLPLFFLPFPVVSSFSFSIRRTSVSVLRCSSLALRDLRNQSKRNCFVSERKIKRIREKERFVNVN